MVPTTFIPPNPDGENERRSAQAERALGEYQSERSRREDRRSALAALLADLMHWADRDGLAFDAELARASEIYARETSGQGRAGSAYQWLCELVATACGYRRDPDSGLITHGTPAGVAPASSWRDWDSCCRDSGIAVDPPDPYEIAARRCGWTWDDADEAEERRIQRRDDAGEHSGLSYGCWRECCEAQRIEPAQLPALSDLARYRLVLEADYVRNGASTRDLEKDLYKLAAYASGQGLQSGVTNGELSASRYRVERIV